MVQVPVKVEVYGTKFRYLKMFNISALNGGRNIILSFIVPFIINYVNVLAFVMTFQVLSFFV